MSQSIHLGAPPPALTDSLSRLLFEGPDVRAHYVQLRTSLEGFASRHAEMPTPLLSLLGEMAAAATLLSSSLKFEGSVSLQLHGDGPVRLAVTECTASLGLRGTLKMRDEAAAAGLPEHPSLTDLVNQHGQGRLSLVLDTRQPDMHPYQGVVPLEGENLAAALEAYMVQSEQLLTRIWLASDGQQSAGLMLQQLPSQQKRDEDWERLCALANTVTAEEMLQLAPQTLLHRLFWEESPLLLDIRQPHFACPCSRARVGRMLANLGEEEVAAILAEQSKASVRCDFCNALYEFDAVDCARLFTDSAWDSAEAATQPGPASTH